MLSKEAMKHYQRSRRKRYPDADKVYNDRQVRYRTELKAKLVQYKGSVCNRCGQQYDPVCFDFHHIDPSKKDFNVSNLLFGSDLHHIHTELDKTVMLCSNCHRLTHKELGYAHGKNKHNTDQQQIW